MIAVGLGAVHAGVQAEIRKLAETHKIPVVLTPMAKGMLPEDHPCYAGVVFHALSDIVGQTHQDADRRRRRRLRSCRVQLRILDVEEGAS